MYVDLALALHRCKEMDVQEVCPSFMILEEDVAEVDEDLVYFDYSFSNMKRILKVNFYMACFR